MGQLNPRFGTKILTLGRPTQENGHPNHGLGRPKHGFGHPNHGFVCPLQFGRPDLRFAELDLGSRRKITDSISDSPRIRSEEGSTNVANHGLPVN